MHLSYFGIAVSKRNPICVSSKQHVSPWNPMPVRHCPQLWMIQGNHKRSDKIYSILASLCNQISQRKFNMKCKEYSMNVFATTAWIRWALHGCGFVRDARCERYTDIRAHMQERAGWVSFFSYRYYYFFPFFILLILLSILSTCSLK